MINNSLSLLQKPSLISMKKWSQYIMLPVFSLSAFLFSGCFRTSSQDEIVRTRYYHPYGPEMNAKMWSDKGMSGEKVEYYASGVALRTTYIDGIQNGTMSWSFPNSPVAHRYEEYDNGVLVSYGVNYENGTSEFQEEEHSDGSSTQRRWYRDGTPKYIEERTSQKRLQNAKYFSQEGDIEAEIIEGKGIRLDRMKNSLLHFREQYVDGLCIAREEFYPNGILKSMTSLNNGQKQGPCYSYSESGEPISIVQWNNNQRNGLQVSFEHGVQVAHIPFKNDLRDGVEIRFQPGTETIVAKISWHNGLKHGPSVFIFPDQEIEEWYWKDGKVTKEQFYLRKKQADFAAVRDIQKFQID